MKFLLWNPLFSDIYECKKGGEIVLPTCVLCHLAKSILLSYQGYTITELAFVFKVDRVTIAHWFTSWETRHFAGLYDKKGKGRHPLLPPESHA